MPKFLKIEPLGLESLEKVGFFWHTDEDGEYVVSEKLLVLNEAEVLAYEKATNELYMMYEQATEYVIKNELFAQLDIPKQLIPLIKESYNTQKNQHLYGRFDLSGGIDSKPIKLIEFNADTPTLLFESVVIQLMMLHANNLQDAKQFNTIYEAISLKFESISKADKGLFSRFLFSCVEGNVEEKATTELLQRMAEEKELLCEFAYLEDTQMKNDYDFWFKLYPWEEMEHFIPNTMTKMLNPAYTLLHQSKGMLAILYELFPDSPYLLKTSFEPLKVKQVKKQMFGREGANIDIIEVDGKVSYTTDGVYDEYKSIYQEYTPFVKDKESYHYQAGVFYSDGACGVGFRRGAEVLDNKSQFIGHLVL